jgi:hypothetical protein
MTRRLVGLVATRDLGQAYAAVATKLGMKTGSLFNRLPRSPADAHLVDLLAKLRRRLAAK